MWFLVVILFVSLYFIQPIACLVAIIFVIFFFIIKQDKTYDEADRAIQFINQYKFSDGFISKYAKKHPALSDAQREIVLDGLRQYFRMCYEKNSWSLVVMPSLAVDEAWHEFILFTRQYQAFCQKAFGYYLHHTPAEAMEPEETEEKGINVAWVLACRDEKIDPYKPERLPKIFAIDSNLAITGGFIYTLDQFKDLTPAKSCGGCGNGGGGCGGCGGGGCGG